MRQEINTENEPLDLSRPILPLAPTTKREKLFSLPSSPAVNMTMEALSLSNKTELQKAYVSRKRQINHAGTFDVLANGDVRQIVSETNGSKVTVQIDDINRLSKGRTPAKKLFVFALKKLNEKALSNGVLVNNKLAISLEELVELGCYPDLHAARRAYNVGKEILTSIKVRGVLTKGKNKIEVEALRVLFTGADTIKGKEGILYLNNQIDWGFLAAFFTVLPAWAFAISAPKAFDLVCYIFLQARQHSKLEKLATKGYFDISFRSIQQRLSLPSEEGNANPNRTIREPLEEAILRIDGTYGEYNRKNKIKIKDGQEELYLQVMYDKRPLSEVEETDGFRTLTIKEWLDKCSLRVYLRGEYLKPFVQLHTDQQRQIQAAQHRKERIIDQAKAINTAKAMEADKKKGNRTE